MYKRLWRGVYVFIMLLNMVFLVGCATSGAQLEETEEIEYKIQYNVPQIEEADLLTNQNLLTGLNDLTDEALGKRPVAVMVNNIKAALPQYGISAADVIFEIPVEGNQTRLMALYADYTQVPKICAVRSCRYYFPAFAKGFDAYYVHWGSDPTIKSYLNSLNINRFDGMANTGGLYGRDSSRRSAGYALEHTGYFDGTRIVEAIDKLKMRSELLESKRETAFNFCEIGAVLKPNGEECKEVYINFGAQSSTLTYDETNNVYLKKHNSNAHIDGKTKEQLAFTNVFVLETSISTRDAKGRKNIDWKGTENSVGYYISNGIVQKIHWSKKNEESYLKFFDENGDELIINRGKSYIAICSKGQEKIK